MIRKILFVDDDRVLQIITKQRLAVFAEHFSLVFANDGLDAIKKLEDNCFSLVCIDLIMPRMKGTNLFSHVRSHFPHIPVIILSGQSKEEMQKLIPPVDVLEYISKPFPPEVLGKCIMKQLHKEADGGIMYNVSPPVFFQFMEMEAKTCTAHVLDNGSQQGGVLYFNEGQLYDVRAGKISGLDGAMIVFGWNDVTVFIEKKCSALENKINLPLQTVIMQAVSMKDEDDEETELQGTEQVGENDFSGGVEDLAYAKLRASKPAEICSMLSDEVAAHRVSDIAENVALAGAIDTVTKIGKDAGFGEFQLGHLTHGTEDEVVIIPSLPPTAITCSSESHVKGIVKILERKV